MISDYIKKAERAVRESKRLIEFYLGVEGDTKDQDHAGPLRSAIGHLDTAAEDLVSVQITGGWVLVEALSRQRGYQDTQSPPSWLRALPFREGDVISYTDRNGNRQELTIGGVTP